MTHAIAILGIAILCAASAVVGRLVLTREQALKTLLVRLPATVMLILTVVICSGAFLIFGVLCFIGGSFYGLWNWWLPPLGSWFEDSQYLINPIVSGRWG